jgi:toxin ParE1/3/4
MTYKISSEANEDIRNIWFYTLHNWSAEQADKYVNNLIDQIEYVAQNPKMGTDYGYIRKGYMRIRVNSHFIFYLINQRKKRVEIIRILNQRMDIKSRLSE